MRTAYLNQLIVDLNAQIEATILIVTHDINTARTVPDNIGLLYRRHLAMFGPREMLLTSQEPVVRQFLNARRQGPIGMSEEKDAAELEAEKDDAEDAAAAADPAAAPAEQRAAAPRPSVQPASGSRRTTRRRPPARSKVVRRYGAARDRQRRGRGPRARSNGSRPPRRARAPSDGAGRRAVLSIEPRASRTGRPCGPS